MDDELEEEKVNEMYDLNVNHVDAVTQPASGRKFLVIKSEDGENGPSLNELLDAAKVAKSKENDQLHEQAESRAKKYGISFKDGKGHLDPPKGKPTDPDQYADPVNYAYPIDSEHIQAAVSYFNHDGQREAGGYTSEEWAKIGKRIASAAGDGYSYQNGKIETPNNKGETKKGVDEMDGDQTNDQAIVPGSQEWEQHDAGLMQQATAGLVALKGLIKEIMNREQAEVAAGHGDDNEQVFGLMSALDGIANALKEVAAVTATEQTETVEKAKCKMTKDEMKKAHDTMMNLCKTAGYGSLDEFHKACKSMGCCDPDDPDDEVAPEAKDVEESKKLTEKAEGDLPDTDKTKPKERVAPNGDKPQTTQEAPKAETKKSVDSEETEEVKKSATSETLVAESVQKALKAAGLDQLGDKLGELLKVTKSVGSLEERLKKIEDQPMPGGPMLRGAAQNNDYYVVRKGQGPDLNNPDVLSQAAQQVQDPYIRNVLQREVAKSIHPAMQNNQ